MLNKEIPFLRIGLPICAGIVAGLWLEPGKLFLTISVILLIVLFGISLMLREHTAGIFYGMALSVAFFVCGLIHYSNEKKSISVLDMTPSRFACTLSDFPEEKENSIKLEVRLNSIGEGNIIRPVKGSMILYNEKETSLFTLLPGDNLIIRCTPQEIMNRGNPDEFDYRFYMQNRGIRYFAFTTTNDIIKNTSPAKRSLVHRSLITRQKIIDMYSERGISGDTLALVAAVTLGEKNLLDPEQKEYFMKAGIMHIMAVSGLHAVILSFFIFKMLFFLGGRLNIIRVVVTLIILWSFAFVTGLTPSVLRATLMFSFLQAGLLMKRPVNNINSVLASAFVLILIRPSVIFDAGFQLSYSAVIFIISFYKALYEKIQISNYALDKLWQMTVVTLVAQVGTLPLTIMLFNQFPVWFILSNLIIVPLSSLLIIIGCLVPLTFPIEFISGFFASVLGFLTGLTESLTKIFSSLPLSVIDNIGLTRTESLILLSTLFLVLIYALYKDSVPVMIPVTAMALFFTTGTVIKLFDNKDSGFIVYNTVGSVSIGIKTGNIMNLITDSIPVNSDAIRHCSTRGYRTRLFTLNNHALLIMEGKNKILISNRLSHELLLKTNPETLILTGADPVIDKKLNDTAPLKKIIISSEAKNTFRIPVQLSGNGIDTIHYVKKSGAFLARF